jgi:hypothetical protein
MTTVFLSGSRSVGRLNEAIRLRLATITGKGFDIVVGDANGADKAFQRYLADTRYQRVIVFCAGLVCRNNLGNWVSNNVEVDQKLKGRDLYTAKDKAMAIEADYGFIIWDGKSTGSINNVIELIKREKPAVVYFAPEKSFLALKSPDDVLMLLQRCDQTVYRKMNDKIQFDRRLRDICTPQGNLAI